MMQSLQGALVAAAIASLVVLSAEPTAAASLMAPRAPGASAIHVDYTRERHGDTHNAFQEEFNEGIGRFSPYYRHYGHRRYYPRARYLGFPFRAMPPYSSYHPGYYGNCFRTWDGQLLCH